MNRLCFATSNNVNLPEAAVQSTKGINTLQLRVINEVRSKNNK